MKRMFFTTLLFVFLLLTGCSSNSSLENQDTFNSRFERIEGEDMSYVFFSSTEQAHEIYGEPDVVFSEDETMMFMIIPDSFITGFEIMGVSGDSYLGRSALTLEMGDMFIYRSCGIDCGELQIQSDNYSSRLNEDFIIKPYYSDAEEDSRFKIKIIE